MSGKDVVALILAAFSGLVFAAVGFNLVTSSKYDLVAIGLLLFVASYAIHEFWPPAKA